MKERDSNMKWFPFWTDKWIFGSMRIECTIIERAIWVDLLALASKDTGFIRANEETPYLITQLAGMLIIKEDQLKAAIKKFIKIGKLKKDNNGILSIAKWDKYQLSERHKRRIKKEIIDKMSGKAVIATTEKAAYKKEDINNKDIKNNIKHKPLVPDDKKHPPKPPKINFNFKTSRWENIKEEDIKIWKEAYPVCNMKIELAKMTSWLLSNPSKKKSNYKKFINNWLTSTQDKGGTRGIPDEETWADRAERKDKEGS